jgi:CheY-like chemotaxis protein
VVLVADDEPTIRRLLARSLEKNYRVVTAAGGPDALRVARCEPVAVAVLDVEMPPPDGLAVAERLLQQRDAPQVILVSGRFQEADWRHRLTAPRGVHACLAKPFEVEELLRLIGSALTARGPLDSPP